MRTAEEEIRPPIDTRIDAVRAKDIDARVSAYASTVVTRLDLPPDPA